MANKFFDDGFFMRLEIYSKATNRYLGLIEVIRVRHLDSEGKVIEKRGEFNKEDLVFEIVELSNYNLAILGFLNHENKETRFSRSLQSLMGDDIKRDSSLRVIERKDFERHLHEQGISYSGFVAKGSEAGKMLGAELIILGEFSELTNELIINARINETETGKVLATSRVVIIPKTHDNNFVKGCV